MKNYLILLMISASFLTSSEQSGWSYTKFAQVSNSSGLLFTLEYGIRTKGYNGYVRWKITNHTNMTVYDVSIHNKEYTLSDGRKVRKSGESITYILAPGESKTSMPDAINSDEHGGFSPKPNPATLNYLSIYNPMITFSNKRYGEQYGWNTVGTVRMLN